MNQTDYSKPPILPPPVRRTGHVPRVLLIVLSVFVGVVLLAGGLLLFINWQLDSAIRKLTTGS